MATVLDGLSFPMARRVRHFKPTLRLVVNSHCNFHCKFPVKDGAKWCHAEGIEGFEPRQTSFHADPSTTAVLRVAEHIRQLTGIASARLAGLEPTLRKDIVELVKGLKNVGFERVGITTNGSKLNELAKSLYDVGLNEVNVSVHSLDRQEYAKITGVDCLPEVLSNIELCQRIGIPSVKVNCVLLNRKRMRDEVNSFVSLAGRYKLVVRFYELFWWPGGQKWQRYHVPWQNFLPNWKPLATSGRILFDSLPMRHRISFALTNGGMVEVDTFGQPKGSCIACKACSFRFECKEGFLGCGVRITPDLHLSPCLYRHDLSIDLSPLGDEKTMQGERDRLTSQLRDRFRTWGLKLREEPSNSEKQLILVP